MRDSQRSRVYQWGWDLGKHNGPDRMTLEQIEALSREVCTRYRIAPVRVKDGRRRRKGCYSPIEHSIKLPVWSRDIVYVLHELAHAIAYSKYGAGEQHGPRFAAIFDDLLRDYSKIDKKKITEARRANKVKVARNVVTASVPKRSVSKIEKLRAEIREHENEIARLRSEIRKLANEKPQVYEPGPEGLRRLFVA